MNIGNSSLKEISALLCDAEKIMIYPHTNMDGDALGSAIALSYALKEMGKNVRIVISEEIPDNLKFLDMVPGDHPGKDSLFTLKDLHMAMDADLSVLIDCGELKRIPGRETPFLSGKKKICIDHHGTTEMFCEYNYIDPDAAATGQIVFRLLKELGIGPGNISQEILKVMGEALFAAITTDTGDYQYSNTQKESHEITAELYDWGIDHNKVSVEIYESIRPERLRLTAEVLSNMELLVNDRVALAHVSQDMLRKTGAKMEETEWIAGDLRSIKGVELAIFLKEEANGTVKTSLRSKSFFDVAELAKKFGGGGHIRAAGYTVETGLQEAKSEIIKAVQECSLQGLI